MGVPDPLYSRPLRSKRSSGKSPRMARLDHVHSAVGVTQILFTLDANMNVITDQVFSKAWDFADYVIEQIRVRDADGTLSTAAGGIYTGAGKTGVILVAAAQAYSGISAVGQGINLASLAAGLARQTATPILSLTTAQGAARTARFEIIGQPLSET